MAVHLRLWRARARTQLNHCATVFEAWAKAIARDNDHGKRDQDIADLIQWASDAKAAATALPTPDVEGT